LALAALALVVFGAYDRYPTYRSFDGYELWRLRLFSFGGYGLALAALALAVFGAIERIPT